MVIFEHNDIYYPGSWDGTVLQLVKLGHSNNYVNLIRHTNV